MNLKEKLLSHLNKKESLNAKLEFLTGFELWNCEEETFKICEEIRDELVRQEVSQEQQKLL